jgi:hypothetical protein
VCGRDIKTPCRKSAENGKKKDGIRLELGIGGGIAIYAVLIVAAFGLAYYLGNRTPAQARWFARCLKDRGVKMYGAWWCPHCVEQKEEFGASFEYVPYVECGIKGDMPYSSGAGLQRRASSIIRRGSFRPRVNGWSAFSPGGIERPDRVRRCRDRFDGV